MTGLFGIPFSFIYLFWVRHECDGGILWLLGWDVNCQWKTSGLVREKPRECWALKVHRICSVENCWRESVGRISDLCKHVNLFTVDSNFTIFYHRNGCAIEVLDTTFGYIVSICTYVQIGKRVHPNTIWGSALLHPTDKGNQSQSNATRSN
jgi:hypothetical protein